MLNEIGFEDRAFALEFVVEASLEHFYCSILLTNETETNTRMSTLTELAEKVNLLVHTTCFLRAKIE